MYLFFFILAILILQQTRFVNYINVSWQYLNSYTCHIHIEYATPFISIKLVDSRNAHGGKNKIKLFVYLNLYNLFISKVNFHEI